MCYLVKGSKGTLFPFQGNSLLYPWVKDGTYSWNWKYLNDLGQERALGPTWSRVAIFDKMPITEWLAYVEGISGVDAFLPYHRAKPWNKVVRVPPPSYRHRDEIRVVMDALRRSERDHFARLAAVDETQSASMEMHFPREFTDCASMKGACPYYQCCVGNLLPAQMVELGFKPRRSHHTIEAAQHAARKE